jgi:hypothetical protein
MKIGSETDMRSSVNRSVGGVYNAALLSSASPAERSVFNGRTTVRPSLTEPAVSNRRAYEPQAN